MTRQHKSTRGESSPGQLMQAEIVEQPAALARLLEHREAIAAVAAGIRAGAPRFVQLVARGTSDHAALYAKYLIETTIGVPCGLVSTSVFTTYGQRPDLHGVLWIAISQSGGSPDLVESTERARAGGAITVSVTNNPGSHLDGAADHNLSIQAGPERSIAATKTYTSSLLTLWLLVRAWAQLDARAAERVPEWVEAALGADIGEVASRYRFVDRLVTTSRGYAYPTARESALKLMETCYLSAHAFSGADLLHGPLAMIDQDRPVLAIVPEGAGGRALAPVLSTLQERGADICVVAPTSIDAPTATRILLPSGMDEQLAPIAQIVPLQRLAYSMAVGRGHDPDHPRGLRKVTETF
jgi:glutamine---fructose-6-phosphate transaminase (isomerizing)